jgi:signal transduction histidine kinase
VELSTPRPGDLEQGWRHITVKCSEDMNQVEKTDRIKINQEVSAPGITRSFKTAWVILAFLSAGIFLSSLPGYLQMYRQGIHNQPGGDVYHLFAALFSIAACLVSFSLAAVLYRARWDDRLAPFISFYLLAYGVIMAGPLESWSLYWLGNSQFAINVQAMIMTTPTIALMALFPNGRFVPAWTRWLVIFSLTWIVIAIVFPISELYAAPATTVWLFAFFILSIFAPGLYAQVYRYRLVSSPEERQQTKWVVFALFLWSTYVVISTGPYFYLETLPPGSPQPWWALATSLGWWISLNILPVSLTIAVLRYRLWDIDIFINRALLYITLTACVIGIYVLTVGTMSLLFQAQVNWWVALLATGLVAVLFQPLRERLQKGVNRILYGQRDDPLAVLTQLGKRIESTLTAEMVIPTLVETISLALKLPYVAITLKRGQNFSIIDSYGKPVEDAIPFPLIYQGDEIGRLLVARRSAGEEFTKIETDLIKNIALQAGTALHAVHLTVELRRSRQESITALEDERRRIRRDLHDGLGPTLAAHMLKVGSARAILGENALQAAQILDELEIELENTLGQIRNLVYDLRPPTLDQLGLAGAIKDYAEQINRKNETQAPDSIDPALVIEVKTPDRLPALPAAVEVAAYRIAQEGLTNVARHSKARNCQVELTCADSLRFTIRDDGIGLPAVYRAGVGLNSMRERAAELGGVCQVKSIPGGGTILQATIPIHL